MTGIRLALYKNMSAPFSLLPDELEHFPASRVAIYGQDSKPGQ